MAAILKDKAVSDRLPDVQKNERISSIGTALLSKRFNREWIFRNFSYEFKAGHAYAITGPNGSGKSTLLQVLWGQMPPSAGTLHYTDGLQQPVAIEKIARHVAIATPYMDLIEEFTLYEQLEFHFKLKKCRSQLPIAELLDIMYLSAAKDKFIGNFSSGMKQRVKLALALYTEADVVFLDEPGTNLDRQAFDWYQQQLRKLPGHTMVFIASNDEAEYPSDCNIINLTKYK